MKENKDLKKRKSIRLKEYDYSQEGMYFITICTQNRECVLSKIMEEYVGPAPTISDIICSFKTRTTGKILKGIKDKKYKPFDKRFWQRNYYEHIIRNEKELYKIKEYIQYNPLNWEKDKYNC